MNNRQSDPNQGDRDQGFLDKQTSGPSSGGVENWAAPQQSSGQYRDWGPASERPQAPQGHANAGFAKQQGNSSAITGFVLSLVCIPVVWVPVINLVLWILAVVFSAIGLSKSNKEGRPHRGLAIAGLVISLLPLVLIILLFAGLLALFGNESSSIGALAMVALQL